MWWTSNWDTDPPNGWFSASVPKPQLDAHFEPENLNLGSGVGTVDKALAFVVQQTGILPRIELLVVQPSSTTEPLLVDIRATACSRC